VFVVAPVNGGIAATTRPDGGIGLPGGKVEPGESPVQALTREAAEEGWDLECISADPIHQDTVDGGLVWWFQAGTAHLRKEWKEQGRIAPIIATREEIAGSGNGNGFMATVRHDIPAILDAVRDASRYNPDYFYGWYRHFADLALSPRLLSHKWIGVACLPLAAIQNIVTNREAVHHHEFGIGAGTTASGRTVFAMIPTKDAVQVGWEREDDRGPENLANIQANKQAWPSDTWLVVATDKDPNGSVFTTDRDEFGGVRWTVFAPEVVV
jgi:hypothetical protein